MGPKHGWDRWIRDGTPGARRDGTIIAGGGDGYGYGGFSGGLLS